MGDGSGVDTLLYRVRYAQTRENLCDITFSDQPQDCTPIAKYTVGRPIINNVDQS